MWSILQGQRNRLVKDFDQKMLFLPGKNISRRFLEVMWNRIAFDISSKLEKSHWYRIYKRRIIYWIYPASANQGGIKRWITRLSSSRMILYIERFTTSACSFYIWIVEYKTWFKLIRTIVHFSSKKSHLCFHINYDRDTLLSDLKKYMPILVQS